MKKSIFTALKNNLSTFSSVFQQENTEHDNIKLFVSHHKPFHQIDLPGYTPIQVGKEKATHQLNMIGDNTGDHISSLNPYFCELTAQYWVWKNVRADHVGFCHYRRFFNIGSRITPNQISLSTFQKKQSILLNIQRISELTKHFDCLLPQKTKLPGTIRENYSLYHDPSDFLITEKILKRRHPEIWPQIDQALNSKIFYHGNMFVLPFPIFDHYMTWLFDILFEAQTLIDSESRDPYQARVFGFLSERLWTIYRLLYIPKNRCKELKVVMIKE